MKKLVLLAMLWMFHLGLHAQAPTKMSYQAVLRNPSGELVGNKQIRVKVSILEKSENGNVVFAEIQQVATNVNGLFSLIVGDGKAESGDIAKIDWSKGLYYIKTEIDPDGGTNFSLVNTSQLLSVPYALYATNATPGSKGDKGETGDKGADGKDGGQGLKGDKGDAGDKGADGKDGAQGLKGDKGEIGDKGADGKDGIQGIKGDKGDAGDKGADGKDGAQGPKGDKGEAGDKGADGKDGIQGPKGDIGLPGDKGADGKDGAQGLKGDKGDAGDKGADGKDGAQGIKGDKGDAGDKGVDGKEGAQGPKGDKGEMGDKGADGKDGMQGPKGDKGDAGDKGADGKDGAQGPKGDKGDTGDKGADGKDGAQGPKGDKGDAGDKGVDGKDGAQGPKGDKGDAGAGFQAGSIKNQLLYWNGTAWVILNPGSNGQRLTICDDELTWAVGGICPGKIEALNCGTVTNNGTLTANTIANGVSSVIAYTGGNGGGYSTQSIPSTGVTGLIATLTTGILANGNGNLTLDISGTPAANGTASFEVNVGGKSCVITFNISDPTSGYGQNISDVEGNTYKTVYIGTQQWLAENLKVTKYNDGTSIPNIVDNTSWSALTSGAWVYYNHDSKNNTKYGKLYNWFVVNPSSNGNKNVCPSGWHVPTDGEWTILTDYVGGSTVAGGKLKMEGTTLWDTPNTDATNSYAFNAEPGGSRYGTAQFMYAAKIGNWWSVSEDTGNKAWYRQMYNDKGTVVRSSTSKNPGASIRCLKGEPAAQPIQGAIQTIDCGTATNNGTLTENTLATSVSSVIAYTGGNGGSHSGQTITSTGVTGLTATLAAGSIANGNGTLTFDISGTPSTNGTASFEVNVGGKTCTLSRNVVIPTSGYGENISDVEGNSYKTVYIGTQQWMGENLKVSKYNDGTDIPNITDNTQWSQMTTGAWAYHNNDIANNTKNGKLYNWYAVSSTSNGNKNVCPTGWHVPSDPEWSILSNYLGGNTVAGGKLKEVGTTNWNSPNTGATNSTLFNGLPAGNRQNTASFVNLKILAAWWSSTVRSSSYSWSRYLDYRYSNIDSTYAYNKNSGLSVRCLKDAASQPQPIQGSIQTIDCGSATNNGTLTANAPASSVSSVIAYTGGNGGSFNAQTINSTGVAGLTATLAAGTFANGNGTLTFNISGTPTANGTSSFAVNIGGKTCTLIRNVVSVTPPTSGYGPNINDVDGNIYKTVYIGTQQWMGENLKVSKYSDGTAIPYITDNTQWENNTTGAWSYYKNDVANNAKYGKLYNWYAVSKTSNKNVCPTGWHVPTDVEWTVLTDYLGGLTVAGGKMKEVGTTSWNSPNTDATNMSLFSALPGGYRYDVSGGGYGSIGNTGNWWSSTEFITDSTYAAWTRVLLFNFGSTFRDYSKGYGLSVRCLRDSTTQPQPIQGAIQTIDCGTATNNGTLTANTPVNGVSSVIAYTGGNGGTHTGQTITSTGVTGLTATLAAGKFAKGDSTLTYEISGTPSASGTASFEVNIGGKTCTLTRNVAIQTSGYGQNISDIDGNTYKTVYIGTQQWMGENLNVSKYNDGTSVPNYSSKAEWSYAQNGAWCHYNNEDSVNKMHGKLYNWFVTNNLTNNNKNICPTGWHVPTDAEWTVLSDYLGGLDVAAQAMKETGTKNWASPNSFATNQSLFSALPSGYRADSGNDGNFFQLGTNCYMWSSTELNNEYAKARFIYENKDLLDDFGSKKNGYTIRCLKGEPIPTKPKQGSIQTIDCGSATNNGTLTANIPANGVSSVLAYTGGNGGVFDGQSIPSTDVTGLTATLAAGSFANGNGTLTFDISGTASTNGTASFDVNVGGKSCVLTINVTNTTSGAGPDVSDIDGNTYKTVYIGNQLWMAENLKTTKYSDGTAIPNVTGYGEWLTDKLGRWTYYGNDAKNNAIYGKLYNGYSVNSNKLCPANWHVPSDQDWTILTDYLGGESVAGGKMKSVGTEYWNSPNTDATNESGFSGLPAGVRYWENGGFYHLGNYTSWWSSTPNGKAGNLWHRQLSFNNGSVERAPSNFNFTGMPIRCVKDDDTFIKPIQGSINTLDCDKSINNGTLTQGSSANKVSVFVPYLGGNGGIYSEQIFPSTNVTGLNAIVEAGQFTKGNDTLIYNISGTPVSTGIANFLIKIGGQECTLKFNVNIVTTNEKSFNPNLTYETIKDQDNNTYKTIVIGNQTWMAENLKTTKYNDGTTISNVTGSGEWITDTLGKWCYHNNNQKNNAIYGKLYNGYAVNTGKLCPTGWHVPSNNEWTILTDYLGGENVAGSKMKSVGNEFWVNPNTGATNESGFSALPGGLRYWENGGFYYDGVFAGWWSSSSFEKPENIWFRQLSNNKVNVEISASDKRATGKSIRCLKNNTPPEPIQGAIQTIDCGTATNNGTLTANTPTNGVSSVLAYTGGNGGTHTGQTITSTGVTGLTATLTAGKFANGDSTLTYEISGTPSADGTASFEVNIGRKTCKLTRNVETVQVSGINFTSIGKPIANFLVNVSDIEGNSYKTVQIGNQVWMAENLKVSKYNDGSIIPNITDNTQWSKTKSGAWSYYNNDSVNNTKYGKIYNWYALSKASNGNKNVCPTGWHVPTDLEWTELIDYLGGASVAGNKLKEIGTTNWTKTTENVSNASLFTGLPGGCRSSDFGYFNYIKSEGWWWSSSGENSTYVLPLVLDIEYGLKPGKYRNKNEGMSVRCINDDTLKLTYEGTVNSLDCGSANNQDLFTSNLPVRGLTKIITYTDGNGGNYQAQIIPSKGSIGLTARLAGGSFANGNGSLNFLIEGTPTSGTASFEVNMGGKSCIVSLVVRIDTIINHESNVTPIGTKGENVIDIDGNTYKSVIIGTQQWMSENLRVSKYNDGTIIPNVKENNEWSKLTSGGWAYYNNDSLINNVYGKLYNWYSVSSINNSNKNVCPIGWHVPSDAEWTILVNYLGGESIAGGKLKETGTAHWNSPNRDATNSALFSAVPGGYRFKDGNDGTISYNGLWWSSSEFNTDNAWLFGLNYSDVLARRYYNFKGIGFSVRCLKD